MINAAGLALVKRWEGFKAKAYQDSVGVWTIGYGTTARAGLGISPKPGMVISEAEAAEYLRKGLEKFGQQIRPYITAPINENEWAAFLSLAYNIGPGAFRTSTALRRFNAGDKKGAAEALQWFDKAGGRTLRGLQNRRKEEADLFLTPPPRTFAPTPDVGHVSGGLIVAIVAIVAGAFFWLKRKIWK